MVQASDAAGFSGRSVIEAFANQVDYCRSNGAPLTARIVAAIAAQLDRPDSGEFIERVRDWTGTPLADALPLRAAGGLHALYLAGTAPQLGPIYAGEPTDDGRIVAEVIDRHEAALLPWLDGPPQTNEAGRSCGFAAGLLWLAGKGLPPRFECLEIGSSAGINLMMDRYAYDLGGVKVGLQDAAMRFAPEWRGPPPPERTIEFTALKGCDVAPIDLTDPAQALRLRAYVWPEQAGRFARLDTAIAEAHRQKPDLVKMDAADFVERQLARPQHAGTTRVLMHSIVWQYVPGDQQDRVTTAMAAAGARATAERPLAWVALESNRNWLHHGLSMRYWPGGETERLLAGAHAHGAWLEWLAG